MVNFFDVLNTYNLFQLIFVFGFDFISAIIFMKLNDSYVFNSLNIFLHTIKSFPCKIQ